MRYMELQRLLRAFSWNILTVKVNTCRPRRGGEETEFNFTQRPYSFISESWQSFYHQLIASSLLILINIFALVLNFPFCFLLATYQIYLFVRYDYFKRNPLCLLFLLSQGKFISHGTWKLCARNLAQCA